MADVVVCVCLHGCEGCVDMFVLQPAIMAKSDSCGGKTFMGSLGKRPPISPQNFVTSVIASGESQVEFFFVFILRHDVVADHEVLNLC